MQNLARAAVFLCWSISSAALLVACDGDECDEGESECVSESLIRSCVPVDGDFKWVLLPCAATETCQGAGSVVDAGSAADGDGGDSQDAGKPSTVAACVGTCQVGAHACVSDALARHCINGGVWQLEPCDVGERCEDGLCAISSGPGTVQACEPDAKACASSGVEKVCQPDGSGWVEQPCAANEICSEDQCVPDAKSSCDDSNTCLDNKTAVRCLGQAKGFELVKCEGDTYCEGGRCRGAVCALGSVCSGANQVRECIEGTKYRDTQCGVNEVCQQVEELARCVPLQCTPGTSACGDPRDAGVDGKKYFTTCSLATAGSGVPEWVRGECTGNTTCNPALASTTNPCSQTCTIGAQRCASDAVTGVNDGFQECGDDGKWGPVTSCNPENQSEKQCALAPSLDASRLPRALCADPVCWWAFANVAQGAEGACEADKLRECQDDGTLGEPSSCPQGVCRALNSVVTADGRTPAACDASSTCEPDEELCLSASGTPTPRYRSCVNGVFGSEIKSCPDDGQCWNTRNDAGKRRKLCGAECSPGSGRCDDQGRLERCDAQGRWGNGIRCAMGDCRVLGNSDASCVLECVPGSYSCTGATAAAGDGYHSGRAEQRVCSNDGTWGNASACSEGETCRTTSSGVSLGCVDCVGPSAAGGNAEGVIDTRCDGERIQDCGSNNSWQTSRVCANDKTCVGPVLQACDTCMGTAGGTFQCTDTNLRNEQICAPCNVPLSGSGTTGIPECTQTAIAAVEGTAVVACSGVDNGGTPSAWAGEVDCCSGYQRTAFEQSGASCAAESYGTPTTWGGVPDCCGNYRTGTAGASFAYCE